MASAPAQDNTQGNTQDNTRDNKQDETQRNRQGKAIVECASCATRNSVPVVSHGTPRCGKCHEDLPWVVAADEASFGAAIDAGTKPVVVDLWAPWCGPCRVISPQLERLAEELRGRIKVVKVNVDENPGLSSRLGVQGIPTLLLAKAGEVVDRRVGAVDAATLRRWVSPHLP